MWERDVSNVGLFPYILSRCDAENTGNRPVISCARSRQHVTAAVHYAIVRRFFKPHSRIWRAILHLRCRFRFQRDWRQCVGDASRTEPERRVRKDATAGGSIQRDHNGAYKNMLIIIIPIRFTVVWTCLACVQSVYIYDKAHCHNACEKRKKTQTSRI